MLPSKLLISLKKWFCICNKVIYAKIKHYVLLAIKVSKKSSQKVMCQDSTDI